MVFYTSLHTAGDISDAISRNLRGSSKWFRAVLVQFPSRFGGTPNRSNELVPSGGKRSEPKSMHIHVHQYSNVEVLLSNLDPTPPPAPVATHPVVIFYEVLLHNIGSGVQGRPYDAQDITLDWLRVCAPRLTPLQVGQDGEGQASQAQGHADEMLSGIPCAKQQAR